MEATPVPPHRDVRINRLRMWFDVRNPDGAVTENDVQSFLNEFAEVHFMSAAAAPSRAEALINNGFTSKHAVASLTAVQLEKFGFLLGHAQALASYMGAQQHRMVVMNSPPSTGVTATGQTSPPAPNDCSEKTQIETAPTKKRPAAEAFPTEAPAPSPAEAPAQSSSKPQSSRSQHARSQCSGVSDARGLVPKNARKVSTCQHIVCSPHNALDLELDKQAPSAARSHSKLNVSLAVHFSN